VPSKHWLEVRFLLGLFLGVWINWLDRQPVTLEIAGSSPVTLAKLLRYKDLGQIRGARFDITPYVPTVYVLNIFFKKIP
jgi:hypothetical protein